MTDEIHTPGSHLAGAPRHLVDAFRHVPRHHCVPAQAWARAPHTPGYWIDRDTDPDTWWQAVHSDTVIVTQLANGEVELNPENAAKAHSPSCSASLPTLVSAGLNHLSIAPHHRVLEIGTGTGWTAGLLCHLTGGEEYVTTVEIDPTLASTARTNLTALGFAPQVIVADGEKGHQPAAPYDRVHVTVGVRRIPHAWLAQTRPGGVLVLPYLPVMRLLRLVVTSDGTATGTFHEDAAYLPLRGQHNHPGLTRRDRASRHRALGDVPAEMYDIAAHPGLRLLFDALIGCPPWVADETVSLGGREASATANRATGSLTQTGSRDLWDEAVRLCAAWSALGRPSLERFGLTVTPDRQFLWLDTPTAPIDHVITTTERTHHG